MIASPGALVKITATNCFFMIKLKIILLTQKRFRMQLLFADVFMNARTETRSNKALKGFF